MKLDLQNLVFSFDGDKISPTTTPGGLGMEDNDIVEVYFKKQWSRYQTLTNWSKIVFSLPQEFCILKIMLFAYSMYCADGPISWLGISLILDIYLTYSVELFILSSSSTQSLHHYFLVEGLIPLSFKVIFLLQIQNVFCFVPLIWMSLSR